MIGNYRYFTLKPLRLTVNTLVTGSRSTSGWDVDLAAVCDVVRGVNWEGDWEEGDWEADWVVDSG